MINLFTNGSPKPYVYNREPHVNLIAILVRYHVYISAVILKNMTNFDFKTCCKNSDLKEATVESLQTEDLDTEDALKLL